MIDQAGSTSNVSKMVSPREVVVRGNVKEFTQEIVVGPHQLMADEPKDMGGDDEDLRLTICCSRPWAHARR